MYKPESLRVCILSILWKAVKTFFSKCLFALLFPLTPNCVYIQNAFIGHRLLFVSLYLSHWSLQFIPIAFNYILTCNYIHLLNFNYINLLYSYCYPYIYMQCKCLYIKQESIFLVGCLLEILWTLHWGYIFNDNHPLKCLGELPDPFNGFQFD